MTVYGDGNFVESFVVLNNRLKVKYLDPLQKRSPSLNGKLHACERFVE
jgi:hypothetical protein